MPLHKCEADSVVTARSRMPQHQRDGALFQWLIMASQQLPLSELGCVGVWLQDLRQVTDNECMCVLQGKSLSKQVSDIILPAKKSINIKDYIDILKQRSRVICIECSKLLRKVEKERWRHVMTDVVRLTCLIRSLLYECTAFTQWPYTQFFMQQQVVMEQCAKLAKYIESHVDTDGRDPPVKTVVIDLLAGLRLSFTSLTDMALTFLIDDLLLGVDKTSTSSKLRWSLQDLLAVALKDAHMCVIITKEAGIERLLAVCHSPHLQCVHVAALRVVATLCSVAESVIRLAKVNGLQYLSSVLEDTSLPELVRSEAAGVIAQVTSPSLNHYQYMDGFIEYMQDLVKALTMLCESATRPEVLLVSCAALANMTFMDSIACDLLLRYHTASVLIGVCQRQQLSIFTSDQVVTVLANMAASESCSEELFACGGVPVLVGMLGTRAPPSGGLGSGASAAGAVERLQQKAAIGLTRLCRCERTADEIVKQNAVPHLMELCREPSSRNDSQPVLDACTAALQTIVAHHGLEGELKSTGLKELLDSLSTVIS